MADGTVTVTGSVAGEATAVDVDSDEEAVYPRVMAQGEYVDKPTGRVFDTTVWQVDSEPEIVVLVQAAREEGRFVAPSDGVSAGPYVRSGGGWNARIADEAGPGRRLDDG